MFCSRSLLLKLNDTSIKKVHIFERTGHVRHPKYSERINSSNFHTSLSFEVTSMCTCLVDVSPSLYIPVSMYHRLCMSPFIPMKVRVRLGWTGMNRETSMRHTETGK